MERNQLTKRLKLLRTIITSRKKQTHEQLKSLLSKYYTKEVLPEEFYIILKNNLLNSNAIKVLNIMLQGNIYDLISFLKNNNEPTEEIEEYLTPQKYFEIPQKHINKIIEELKKLPKEKNTLHEKTSEELLWQLKRGAYKTENEYKEIAYKMYQSIGFENSIELLMQKYGAITYEQIHFMFSNFNTKRCLTNTEQQAFNNFLFSNKKDFNNTLRQMLNGQFSELFLNFDYFYNNLPYFINHLGTKMPKLKVKELIDDRFLTHDVATPEITSDILDDMLSSYYCKYETLDTPKEEIYRKNYEVYKQYLRKKYQSSIPRIPLIEENGMTSEILKLSDPRNLVIGYRAGNCFRINGDASILFSIFLKSDHMRLLSLSTEDNKDFAMMLIFRNGNVLIGQGIEISKRIPNSIKNKDVYDICRKTLKQMMDYMNSQGDEIVATIIGNSNSNVSDYNNQILPFLVSPILETNNPFYNGIYNYQSLLDLSEGKTLHDIKLSTPTKRYFDERECILSRSRENPNYDKHIEIEKRLIALRYARYEEEHDISFYHQLITRSAIYTSCNNDWYVTLYDDGTIDGYISNTSDPRAQEEYNNEVVKLKVKK